jgi:nicotinate-nucleotide adenylyltransferase
MKIGLFFGSFNPVHIGHLIIANTMAENTDLDQVWFVVSPQNPFKKNLSLLHEFDRLDMVEIACRDHDKLKVSDIEFNLPKPNYTIDSLTYIQEKFPLYSFKLIIGEDNLEQFPKWKNYEKILEYFDLYIYPRPGAKNSVLKQHSNTRLVEAPLLDISATYIRECIKNQRSIRYLVPREVEEYIIRKKFYQ